MPTLRRLVAVALLSAVACPWIAVGVVALHTALDHGGLVERADVEAGTHGHYHADGDHQHHHALTPLDVVAALLRMESPLTPCVDARALAQPRGRVAGPVATSLAQPPPGSPPILRI